jgi:hypothetical protein
MIDTPPVDQSLLDGRALALELLAAVGGDPLGWVGPGTRLGAGVSGPV